MGNTGSSTDYTFTTITADGIAPEITSFEIPGISSSTAITVNFTASDNIGVTGYLITETSTTPSLSDPRWETTPTTTYIFSVAEERLFTLGQEILSAIFHPAPIR
jgi:hypothetical protein